MQQLINKTNKAILSVKWQNVAMSGCAGVLFMATPATATDLEIYKGPEYGQASVMMMLDNSESMGPLSIGEDFPDKITMDSIYDGKAYDHNCVPVANPALKHDVKTETLSQRLYDDEGQVINGSSVQFNVTYCLAGNTKYYDRMSRLKMALVSLFTNPKGSEAFGENADLTKFRIGLGTFFQKNYKEGFGKIDAPIVDLTLENRKKLLSHLITIDSYTNTPVAHAYAEAGAYMLGTSTDYADSNGLLWGGIAQQYSSSDTYSGGRYISPLSDPNVNQCSGYGVYFLTDGEPNNAYNPDVVKGMMRNSLGNSRAISENCQSGGSWLTSNGTIGSTTGQNGPAAWECIGEYSRALNNDNNIKGTAIKTATVGFGNVYKELASLEKITTTVKTSSGKSKVVEAYNCDSDAIKSQDAKNLCKLGERNQGFGEGGFYYAQNARDIAKSVIQFIGEVGADKIEPVSTGNMSVPLDSLSTFKSRKMAYVPILEPNLIQPGLWLGNLKKYNIVNGTLEGANKSLVFKNEEGQFSNSTWDIWNTITDTARSGEGAIGTDVDNIPNDALRPDRALPQVGGAFQKVFENKLSPSDTGSRHLFVNSGGRLISMDVNQNKQVSLSSRLSARYNNKDKLNLLQFLGYQEANETTIENSTTLKSNHNQWSKNIGGVLHSVPQLVTTEVKLDSEGKFIDDTRKDYIIYGSMDGALHLLDDATGKEIFNFIPKQILDLQSAALISSGTTRSGRIPYGVDGPWLTYTSYDTIAENQDDKVINLYKSDQIYAMGGLRMGGSMYYGLDLTDVKSPKMLYSVGSTYANKLEKLTTTVQGIHNDAISTNVSDQNQAQRAFSRMGQTWAKPAIGYVKSGGERVMVNFLPGGYDECYEDPNFKLNTSGHKKSNCDNKNNAQGNAMYMVKVGVEKSRDNKKTYFDSSSDSGKLLWWASNSGTSSNSNSSALQYTQAEDLKHSIVTQVRVIDRNYDGLTDHIYFADLGGQVWRADINNNKDTNNFQVDRVQKILDVSDQASKNDAPPRFYERPLVTFYNGEYAFEDSKKVSGSYKGVMALVTVGTGDRSNPVSAVRNTSDALYSIIDKDVTRTDLFDYSGSRISNISLRTPTILVGSQSTGSNKLAQLTFTEQDIGAEGIKNKMKGNVAQGWYMPLTHWMGNKVATDQYKIKMMNEPDALAGILISSSYNPDIGDTASECGAGLIGTTQRERTCLPYGTCDDNKPTTRAYSLGGVGIADNFVTQFNDTPLFTSLKSYCVGEDCEPTLVCPNGNCKKVYVDQCEGDNCNTFTQCSGSGCVTDASINTDESLNPLEWMEF